MGPDPSGESSTAPASSRSSGNSPSGRPVRGSHASFTAAALGVGSSSIRAVDLQEPCTALGASTSCRAVPPAVGCSVTLKCTSRRRSWLSTTSTNRTRKVAVGTVRKSNATILGVVLQKRAPRLRRRPPRPEHVLRYRRLRYRQAQLQQLAMDPRRTPKRIGAADPPNQASDLRLDRGPTVSTSTLPRPVAPEPMPVPADHVFWPHHLQRIPPALPEPRQHEPEHPVHNRQPGPRLARLPHGELLPKREVLQRQLSVRANQWIGVSQGGSKAI